MIQFIVSILVILAFFISLYGWGRLVSKFLYPEDVGCWPYSVVLGLASWILLGGILNVIHLAYPVTLYAIFGLGVLLSLVFGFSWITKVRPANSTWPTYQGESLRPFSGVNLLSYGLPLSLALVAVAFLVATLLPGDVFNYHDDFHTYFVRPVRMLQTGSMGGDSFDLLGIDSLGSQAFLQSFVVAGFPINYINGFDAILGFGLYAFLLIEIARRLEIHWVYIFSSLLIFIIINPQYTNVSALYSGSVLILALIFASCLLTRSYSNQNPRSSFLMAIPVAVLLSCLISLKLTFVVYSVFYFLVYFGLSILFSANRKLVAVIGAFTALVAIISITPWLVLHWPNYSMLLGLAPAGLTDTMNTVDFFSRLTSGNFNKLLSLLSFDTLFWGGSYLDYNFVIVLLATALVISLYLLKSKQVEIEKRYLIPILSSCAAGIVSYFTNAYVFSSQLGVRYSCPVLIASLPAVLLLLGKYAVRHRTAGQVYKSGLSSVSRLGIMLLVSQGILVVLFSDVLIDRATRAYNAGTLVSFSIHQGDVRYSKAALSDQSRESALSLQSKTEKGETILVWMSVPFHLDFARNRILTVMEPGLDNPWLNIPASENPESLVKYLRQLGVRYVMWEHAGYGMKTIREVLAQPSSHSSDFRNNIYLRKTLTALANRSKILHYNDRIVVIDMGKG